jgi:hypothetical protein
METRLVITVKVIRPPAQHGDESSTIVPFLAGESCSMAPVLNAPDAISAHYGLPTMGETRMNI